MHIAHAHEAMSCFPNAKCNNLVILLKTCDNVAAGDLSSHPLRCEIRDWGISDEISRL